MKFTLAAVSCLAVALAGCNAEQQLTLNVRKPLDVKSGSKTVAIAPGTYAMKLSVGQYTATAKLVDSQGINRSFKLKSFKGLKDQFLSTSSTSTVLTSSQLEQPFDLKLTKNKKLVKTGPVVQRALSCILGYHTEYSESCTGGGSYCDANGYCTYDPPTCTTTSYQVADYGTRLATGRDLSYVTTTNLEFVQAGDVRAQIAPKADDSVEFKESSSTACR